MVDCVFMRTARQPVFKGSKMTQFTDELVRVCKGEYARWDNGDGRETWGKPQHAKDY
jgi:hypothetical protein